MEALPFEAAKVYRGARTAYRTGKNIYGTAKRDIKYVKKAGKWAKKTLRKSHGQPRLGHDVGVATAKSDIGSSGTVNTDTRTLTREAILNVGKSDAINARERDIIDLRGFKICLSAINNLTNLPLYLNVAVLSSKFDPTAQPVTTNFFRGEGNTRGADFDLNRQSVEFHCLPVNTDKYFVMSHKRYMLSRFGDQNQDHLTDTYYVPINRQIRYDTSDGNSTNRQFYLVWWCDALNEPSTSIARTDAMQFQWKTVTYFREPRT